MSFLGAQMYFTKQKVSTGRSEQDGRFVDSRAVSRLFIGCTFQTNVAHGNRDTGNNV